MDNSEIISFLEDNDLSDIEEIKQNDEYSIMRFYYDFDRDEINAAKSYSNEESDFEEESDEWYREYYIPFLKDIAIDNAESIIEELVDEFEVECSLKDIGMESGESGYFKFLLALSEELTDSELEEILNDYDE